MNWNASTSKVILSKIEVEILNFNAVWVVAIHIYCIDFSFLRLNYVLMNVKSGVLSEF